MSDDTKAIRDGAEASLQTDVGDQLGRIAEAHADRVDHLRRRRRVIAGASRIVHMAIIGALTPFLGSALDKLIASGRSDEEIAAELAGLTRSRLAEDAARGKPLPTTDLPDKESTTS